MRNLVACHRATISTYDDNDMSLHIVVVAANSGKAIAATTISPCASYHVALLWLLVFFRLCGHTYDL